MFYLKEVICVLDCCEYRCGKECFARVFVSVEFIRVEFDNILSVRFLHLIRLHQNVHAYSIPRTALPQYVRQGTKKNSDMVLNGLSDPAVDVILKREFSLFEPISELGFIFLKLMHLFCPTQDNFRFLFSWSLLLWLLEINICQSSQEVRFFLYVYVVLGWLFIKNVK